MKGEPTNVRAAFVGGLFAVTTACITGAFLIVNTLIQTGFIILGPSLQIGGFGAQAAIAAGPVDNATPTPQGERGRKEAAGGAQGRSLDSSVKSGRLLCAAGEALEAVTADGPLRFPEGQGPGVVCWIGPQDARANGGPDLEVKEVRLPEGEREGAALNIALAWGQELAAGAGDCRSTPAECPLAGVAVIRPDGKVLRP